ncbi:acyclic terpene utilization AtuA family protein [Prauserella flavalba]|uniref:Acyclic terpene utilisation N-terminal domain-containing protein n=1 Tax=Prauserella flavalba TaxID=1477506 RepID=A0A318LD41_9PSEU|nr:acyclic terpene utilization AtuA family protein [Prauserella flavalba]PXY23904.1 hypothetical protein BA062_26845 [Prauserella flavalba]
MTPANDTVRLLAASGQLGYGIPVPAFEAGVAERPDMIGADMGSIDPGPHYLGSGKVAAGESGIVHDLALVLGAARSAGVPALIGNAGTAGRDDQLAHVLDLADRVLADQGRTARVVTMRTQVDRELLRERLRAGRVRSLPHVPPLTEEVLDATEVVVGQVGPERWLDALEFEPDVVLSGRSLDTAIFSAYAMRHGIDRATATHAAKILECTSLAAARPGRDASLGVLRPGAFDFRSCGENRPCTPRSVAAHAFYEQSDPSRIVEPGGHVDLRDARYEQLPDDAVRVSGSTWVPADGYAVKIEGARRRGWRALSVAGVLDPCVFARRAEIDEEVRAAVRRVTSGAQLRIVWSGGTAAQDGVAYPASVLLDVVASTEDEAMSAAGAAKQYLLHASYEGLLNNGGNVAFPFSPEVVSVGPAYEFSVYHLLELNHVSEVGVLDTVTIGKGQST